MLYQGFVANTLVIYMYYQLNLDAKDMAALELNVSVWMSRLKYMPTYL